MKKIEEKMLAVHEAIFIVSKETALVAGQNVKLAKMIKELLKFNKGTAELAQLKEERRSLSALYFSIFMGALVGVIGNFFASLWFQPQTELTIAGLAVSGLLLLIIGYALWRRFREYK